jgi:hypothetical protein
MVTNQKNHYLKKKRIFRRVIFFLNHIKPVGTITPEGDCESFGHAT